MSAGKAEASVGELVGTLARDTGLLIRQELKLASTEMTLKAKAFGHNAGLVMVGGALLLAGLLALMAATIAGLVALFPLWASALLVGLVVLAVGAALVLRGYGMLRHLDPVPERTMVTIADDVAWAKEQIR